MVGAKAPTHQVHLLLGRSRLGASTSTLYKLFTRADWFPLLRCWGIDTFAREQSNRCVSSILLSADVRTSAELTAETEEERRSKEKTTQAIQKYQGKRTSYTEYEVDAWVHEADEGRGDRRNVWGELHPSYEPQDSEWGNPSRVMSGYSSLNT